jgi:hypothetical protein
MLSVFVKFFLGKHQDKYLIGCKCLLCHLTNPSDSSALDLSMELVTGKGGVPPPSNL